MENKKFYVWENYFGFLYVSETEYGHNISDCLGIFETREKALEFIQSLLDDDDDDDDDDDEDN